MEPLKRGKEEMARPAETGAARRGVARRYLELVKAIPHPSLACGFLALDGKGEQWRPGFQISWGPGRRRKAVETRRGGKGKGGAGFSCLFIQFPVAELGFLGVKPLESRKLLLFFPTFLYYFSQGRNQALFFQITLLRDFLCMLLLA